MATLGTTQKCLSGSGGCLIKHLYEMTTNQNVVVLGRYSIFFPTVKLALVLFLKIKNVLRFKMFAVTLAPKQKLLLFYQSKF